MPTDIRTRGIAMLDTAWERAAQLIPHVRERRKGGRTTHSDVLREAIDIGLAAMEDRAKGEA